MMSTGEVVKCSSECGVHIWKGDGYCDDVNNICGCGWDGGDCCGNKKDAKVEKGLVM